MAIPHFNEIKILSNTEIAENITKVEKELFDLKFKKSTRQSFKSHEIKYSKRRIAQLKTLLTLRVHSSDLNNTNNLELKIKE